LGEELQSVEKVEKGKNKNVVTNQRDGISNENQV